MTNTNPTPLLRCVHCEYDLREQAHDAQCPECGLAVRVSAQSQFFGLTVRRMKRMSWGLRIGGWAGLGMAANGLVLAGFEAMRWRNVMHMVEGPMMIWPMAWLLGLVIVQSAMRPLDKTLPERWLAYAMVNFQVRGALGAIVLTLALLTLEMTGTTSLSSDVFLFLIAIPLSAIPVGLIVQGRWMAAMNMRLHVLPQRPLRWRVFQIISVTATVLLSPLILQPILIEITGIGQGKFWDAALEASLTFAMILWAVLILWLSVEMIVLAKRLRKHAKHPTPHT